MTTLRRATDVDAPAIARVHLEARRAAGDRFPPSVHPDAALVPHLLADVLPRAEVWVAERDGAVLGVLALDGDLIDQLYVAPESQGEGLGSRLLALAKERRPAGLRLWVFVSNEPARMFYATRGFVVVGGTAGEANEEGAPDLLLAWERALA